MSTALGMIPLMTFVPVEGAASREYVAAFRQNALQRLHKGEPAELMFPAIPAPSFTEKWPTCCRRLARASSGAGQIADHRRAQYPWPGAGGAEGDRSAFCRIRSAAGATLEAAVYSDHLKELSLIRKILIRMKSWENYIYLDH